MQQRAQLLRQLVLDSQYVIDEHLVATAILARAATRSADRRERVPQRRAHAGRAVRSFRPSSDARSFRPCTMRSLDRRRVAAHLGLM